MVDIEHNATKLSVFIDTDEGVNFTKCQKLSRKIESYLDESQVLGEKYILEVSSPGISRPLKFNRQYPRNVGRKIVCKLKNGEKLEGTLQEVGDEVIKVERKLKKKEKEIIEIEYNQIESSKIKISFEKKKRKK